MAHIGFDSPLEGVRVLDLSRLLPGPFCSMLLADMGADVVKIEDPTGGDYARWYPPLLEDGHGAFFAAINRNKRSLALDLKNAAAVEVFHRLVADADVVLESFRPGVADRLGVGFRHCADINPCIVYCAITGFGQDGPLARRAGHDLGYLALSGTLEQTGAANGPPIVPGFQLADIAGGALYATSAITAALYNASRGAQASFLDIAMTEGSLSFHVPLQRLLDAGQVPERGRTMLTGGLPCYRVYETADGRHLAVGALEPKFWLAFVQAIGLPELATDGLATGESGARVTEAVQARLREATLSQWMQRIGDVDCCVEPVLRPAEIRKHPQHQARGVFFDIVDEDGRRHPQVATPLTTQDTRESMTPAPKLGADTDEILDELGLDDEEIADYRDAGAFGSNPTH